MAVFKCGFSDEYYSVADEKYLTKKCSLDPYNYQNCGLSRESRIINNNLILCSDLICPNHESTKFKGNNWAFLRKSFYELYCDAILTVEINMTASVDTCTPLERKELCPKETIRNSEIIVQKCDTFCQNTANCIDEAICNGFQYGTFCEKNFSRIYVKATEICDRNSNCDDRSDEKRCFRNVVGTNHHNSCYRPNIINPVPIFNFTRCGPLEMTPTHYFSYCEDFTDQTNCSDPLRGVLRCKVDGHDSTISSAVLCKGIKTFCDDGMDGSCEFTSHSCYVHKHLLCNSIKDCNDGSDELGSTCKSLLSAKCQRRYYL